MKLSVGLLHTGWELLGIFSTYEIPANLHGLPGSSFVASGPQSANVLMRCGWVELDEHSHFKISVRGQKILAETDFQERLRLQIEGFIEAVQPLWCNLIPHGRSTVLNGMETDIKQCFRESGLMETPPSEKIVVWWDRLASKSRGRTRDIKNEIGRQGERLSIAYETRRVGKLPKWQAIESNSDGYDIMSSVSYSDATRLTIEVKASRRPIDTASFFISRNEWAFATEARSHTFHIWADIDGSIPKLAQISVERICPHIPTNQGSGIWEAVEIPYDAIAVDFNRI